MLIGGMNHSCGGDPPDSIRGLERSSLVWECYHGIMDEARLVLHRLLSQLERCSRVAAGKRETRER
jgi:hypothetical protein